ncbi:cobyric acid synthase [Blastococcus sp. MG754426]|uniref:cobyric acid synthase n=1 Tax=unclassified Blastococcus TaxID=2619396 RepID=UPI001EF04541|nr:MULTISPECIES: cobyric acid synthase [unclassified Blastococcus]MCF6510109.1 cobyric acid synthase [Blastococcus sp. MG754426]MCF6514388.1 cobyric acid synthase [Blastococcus sp. MG754427]MCF6737600.1 cobyric acid synthase [Blastococcus sp. KM273129]
MSGALLVAGTTSDAGKSVVTAGICRWLVRQGVSVAPFKAQNMSNNSVVAPDGAEIGRAQVMQAAAARVEPEAAMNPVLLKPGGDDSSQVVVLGRPVADVTALSYRPMKAALLEQVLSSLADLRARFDVVVCEGAGSPTEINLRADDIANMGLATAADLPVVVVGDIDRGGVFAALHGTVALMPPADQRLVAGFLVNKFRGDVRLLRPGLDQLTALTGRPVLGVLPWLGGLELDVEDSLDVPVAASGTPPVGDDVLRVSVARLPRLSNFTDLDALAVEPGVLVRYATRPEELADADLVVLPGSRATVADLAWLRATGLADAVLRRAAEGTPVLGICGGHQMLARTITDEVESRAGTVDGLALLPADVRFAREKTLARPVGRALGETVHGYEIHHGVVTVDGDAEPFLDGARAGAVFGTTWHGALENDGFRRAFLAEVARITGRRFVPAPATEFAAVREARLDRLGDLVAEHADTDALWRLVEQGPPAGLPLLPPGSGFSPR